MKKSLFPIFVCVIFSCNTHKVKPEEIFTLEVLQRSNLDYFGLGEDKKSTVVELLNDKSSPALFRSHVRRLYRRFLEADSLTAQFISGIEQVKWEMFHELGEELSFKKQTSILADDFKTEHSSRPKSYRFRLVKSNTGTQILEENTPLVKDQLRKLRKNFCGLLQKAWMRESDEHFSFQDPQINQWSDLSDFDKQFNRGIKKSRLYTDDLAVIREIYFLLTIPDSQIQSLFNEKKSWVDAMNVLMAIENNVLKARELLFTQMLYGRIGCMAGYSFSHILPLVNGANAAIAGDTVQLQLMIAAHDEYQTPEIAIHDGGRLIGTKNGIGEIEVIVPDSKDIEIKGTITVFTKSGIPKTLPWSHHLRIIPKHLLKEEGKKLR